MIEMLKRSLFLGFLAIFSMVVIFQIQAAASEESGPDQPVPIVETDNISISGKAGNGNDETPGQWYIGDTPSQPVSNAPVLLFVPGLNNVAQIFWEDNDMYETALNAGYQTAFIQMHDAGGASADMWDNGELLAEKIEEISNHFNGAPITIVAYSKGGVDTQTALAYYGAWQYVDNVITLSSPHHGSQLADLAYSSWAGWIADLIGARGDGTYAMQTANMENFRTQMEQEPFAYYNDFYTLGGTDWGSMFSSNWFGGTYLSQYGPNDGVVTVESSNLPGGQEVDIGDWNHTSIRTGETFPVFEPYLMAEQSLDISSSAKNADNNSSAVNQWIHGGALDAGAANELSLAVEDGVKNISLHIMTSTELSDISLIDPSGEEVTPNIATKTNKEDVFAGATSHYITLDNPMAGEWFINMDAMKDDGYLLLADYTAAPLIVGNEVSESKGIYQVEVDRTQVQQDTMKATYHITQSSSPENSTEHSAKGVNLNLNIDETLAFKKRVEVYNVTVDIEGLTSTGEVFKRTIVDSVFID
ncbi:esterase/lipase family protein [Virgibacillus kimchii]